MLTFVQFLILIATTTLSFPEQINQLQFVQDFKEDMEIQTIEIPFSPQAPFAEWTDERQQDGCEEASSIMAVYGILGKTLTYAEAKTLILDLSDYEIQTIGSFHDTSAEDTAKWIIQDYLKYPNVEVKKNIKAVDIIFELFKGNLVIVPVNGQALENPYFSPPGPDRHMLVIKGYDKEKNEFITNDPGTKFGENYRYKADLLFRAIQNYPTGNHREILIKEKIMIVLKK